MVVIPLHLRMVTSTQVPFCPTHSPDLYPVLSSIVMSYPHCTTMPNLYTYMDILQHVKILQIVVHCVIHTQIYCTVRTMPVSDNANCGNAVFGICFYFAAQEEKEFVTCHLTEMLLLFGFT